MKRPRLQKLYETFNEYEVKIAAGTWFLHNIELAKAKKEYAVARALCPYLPDAYLGLSHLEAVVSQKDSAAKVKAKLEAAASSARIALELSPEHLLVNAIMRL